MVLKKPTFSISALLIINHRHKVVAPEKAGAMLSLQGAKMGRPSHVHMSIGVEGGEIRRVQVGGEAVLAGEGTLYIP